MTEAAALARTVADHVGVTFRLADAHRRLRSVRLYQQVGLSGDRLGFSYREGVWRLRVARPAVDRMEYLLELEQQNGNRETILDPANPEQVPGAFGAKSVIEFPEYRAPEWLSLTAPAAHTRDLSVRTASLHGAVHGSLWAPATLGHGEPAPLLVVHDGPEFAALGSFLRYTGIMIAFGLLPELRVALLAPGNRNRHYGADPGYARALCTEVLTTLAEIVPATTRIGVGLSLGALAMLHAHRLYPETFSALFLQSGSFFQPDLDPQEQRFSRYRAVTRFVSDVVQAVADPRPLDVVLTCGAVEENLANNQRMCRALNRLGYRAELHQLRDAHNYVAWRDALHPHFTDLVSRVVAHAA